jgi:hypothetical protein
MSQLQDLEDGWELNLENTSTLSLQIQVNTLQSVLCRTLSEGVVPVEREIEMRGLLSQYLLNLFEQTRRPSSLHDAIEHVEVILRRLTKSSPDLPLYLDSLSYMRVSEYGITKSTRALDQAVELSLRAKGEASKSNLLNRDPELYFKILNDLGYVLSHQYGEHERAQDLEDAINWTGTREYSAEGQ